MNHAARNVAPQAGRSTADDEAALTALRAQVDTLAHELESLRNAHQQLHTYHHHLRFRIAERTNVWLRSLPRFHTALRRCVVTAQAMYQICKGARRDGP